MQEHLIFVLVVTEEVHFTKHLLAPQQVDVSCHISTFTLYFRNSESPRGPDSKETQYIALMSDSHSSKPNNCTTKHDRTIIELLFTI